MITKYGSCRHLFRVVIFLGFFLFYFPANAHDNPSSHDAFKGLGDGYRALMSKDGYGSSIFTIHAYLDETVTNQLGESSTKNVVEKVGTAFFEKKFGVLLTNDHVINFSEIKKSRTKEINDAYAALDPPQKVNIHFTESYKAVDLNDVSFLVSLVKTSASIDAAILRFQKEPLSPTRGFILQNETLQSFSLVGVPGSSLEIPNTLVLGNMARTKLHQCSDDEMRYMVFISSLNPGSSGSPIYNMETDKVNGMMSEVLLTKHGNNSISCAVPASALIKFLNESLPSPGK